MRLKTILLKSKSYVTKFAMLQFSVINMPLSVPRFLIIKKGLVAV